MKPAAWILAPALALLLMLPLGILEVVAVIATPAVAEQLRIDPCSGTSGGAAPSGLPEPGTPRGASLHNPASPIPAPIQNLYKAAAAKYGLPWPLLAGVGMEETNHGRNNHTSSTGAQGLMQFMPATWATYGVDGDGDHHPTITNGADSIYSAANYLAASGARGGGEGVRRALFTYNHSLAYVNDVLFYTHAYHADCAPEGTPQGPLPPGPEGTCPPSGSAAERGLKPETLRMLRCVVNTFPWVTHMGGVGRRPNISDHPSGHAVDFMIPRWNTPGGRTRGWAIAHWLQKNAAHLHVKYIIFDRKVWRAYRPSQGWTPYHFPGPKPWGPTQLHENHVHCSVY